MCPVSPVPAVGNIVVRLDFAYIYIASHPAEMENLPPNRRDLNKSDESSTSIMSTPSTIVRDFAAGNMFSRLWINDDATQLRGMQMTDVLPALDRLLSTRSAVSTTSSAALRENEAAQYPPAVAAKIGEGYCGEVFSLVGTKLAIKRAKAGKINTDMLKAEWLAQEAIYTACRAHAVEIRVPQPGQSYDIDDGQFWEDRGQLLPATASGERRFCLEFERILPMVARIRQMLIHDFCHPAHVEAALQNPDNRDCLIRLYLGQRGTPGAPKLGQTFTLRNFPLTLDKFEHLILDISYYARRIGEGLAIVHWAARFDGRDIEWVMGSSPAQEDDIPTLAERKEWMGQGQYLSSRLQLDFRRRTSYVWLLDFNQCKPISLDEAGINMAASAFFDNDPYYPRAGHGDGSVWRTFAEAYLAMGQKILDPAIVRDKIADLPKQFVDKVAADPRAFTQTGQGPPPSTHPVPAVGNIVADPPQAPGTPHRARGKQSRSGRTTLELGEPGN